MYLKTLKRNDYQASQNAFIIHYFMAILIIFIVPIYRTKDESELSNQLFFRAKMWPIPVYSFS